MWLQYKNIAYVAAKLNGDSGNGEPGHSIIDPFSQL